jgi:hypothetical protein
MHGYHASSNLLVENGKALSTETFSFYSMGRYFAGTSRPRSGDDFRRQIKAHDTRKGNLVSADYVDARVGVQFYIAPRY